MSQVPGLEHVTSRFYSTLFHSPPVGVDKETLATCTLSFLREIRRNNLWQLNYLGHNRNYLSLDSTKRIRKGDTSSPHMPRFPVFLKSWSCQPLSQSIRNILSTLTFDKFYRSLSLGGRVRRVGDTPSVCCQ
jgi:hypothetical protein